MRGQGRGILRMTAPRRSRSPGSTSSRPQPSPLVTLSTARPAGPSAIRWRAEIPLTRDHFVRRDVFFLCTVATALTALLFAPLLGFNLGADGVGAGVLGALIVGGALGGLAWFVLRVVMRDRWLYEYALAADGIEALDSTRRVRAEERSSWLRGTVDAHPIGAGPERLAESQGYVLIPWSRVRAVERHPDHRVIAITGGVAQHLRLYCSPSNYAEVAHAVEQSVRAASPKAAIH